MNNLWSIQGAQLKMFICYQLRLDFRRSLVSGLPSPRRDGWTRERQSMERHTCLMIFISIIYGGFSLYTVVRSLYAVTFFIIFGT